jgi:hypothetical protein
MNLPPEPPSELLHACIWSSIDRHFDKIDGDKHHDEMSRLYRKNQHVLMLLYCLAYYRDCEKLTHNVFGLCWKSPRDQWAKIEEKIQAASKDKIDQIAAQYSFTGAIIPGRIQILRRADGSVVVSKQIENHGLTIEMVDEILKSYDQNIINNNQINNNNNQINNNNHNNLIPPEQLRQHLIHQELARRWQKDNGMGEIWLQKVAQKDKHPLIHRLIESAQFNCDTTLLFTEYFQSDLTRFLGGSDCYFFHFPLIGPVVWCQTNCKYSPKTTQWI